ncbi:MAG: NUDIX hydrolase [Myxococcales bacterium]|nr:NUDIX hydrolase [Myxococcales bacterium]
MTKIVGFHVDSDELLAGGGFLKLRRLRMRNQRDDGSLSEQYCCDSMARPYGQDAVVVAVFARGEHGVDVLLRDGLRPPITLARSPAAAPLPEDPPGLFVTELVAGIIETTDKGESGLRARAAAEVLEEAGFVVDPACVMLLGAGMFAAPGALVEKEYFTAVEVEPAAQQPLAGDGSPMEEGATTRWLGLDDAIDACVRGDIVDMKTEACLRRLRDALARPVTPGS